MLLFFLGTDGPDKCVHGFFICHRSFSRVYYAKWHIHNLNVFKERKVGINKI